MNPFRYLTARLRASRYLRGIRRIRHEVGPLAAIRSIARPDLARGMAFAIGGGSVPTITGATGTGNVTAGTLEVDMSETILELEPNSMPLLVLSKKATTTNTVNPRFTWWEDRLNARFDLVNGAQTNVDTAIEVDTGAIWAADDLGYNSRTGETFRVVSVAANVLTVVRGVGSTAAAMNDNDEIIRVGSAAQEGALDKPARSKQPVEIANYTQIFREPVEETATKRSTADKTKPRSWDREVNHAAIEHGKDIEYSALFGHPSIDTSGTHPRRTTGGFNHYATQNITDVGGAMTEPEFFAALTPVFRYGSRRKFAMCAAPVVDIISGFPRTKLRVENPMVGGLYGVDVTEVLSPHGRLYLATHWLLEGSLFSQQLWIVDLDNVGYRYLHGDDGSRDTHTRPEIQAPGADTRKDELLTECGFVFGQPLTHGKVVNITS